MKFWYPKRIDPNIVSTVHRLIRNKKFCEYISNYFGLIVGNHISIESLDCGWLYEFFIPKRFRNKQRRLLVFPNSSTFIGYGFRDTTDLELMAIVKSFKESICEFERAMLDL